MTFLDLWEQTVVTEVVKRRHEALRLQAGGEEDFKLDGEAILPLKSHNGRYARIRIQDILPTGMAHFKAPGASPAFWTKKPRLREEVIELVDIDEFHRIDPVEMLKMKSPDPNVQSELVWSIADRGADMADRNVLRTEWMRWQALKGSLVVDYPDAGSVTIDYGIPVGHFKTFGVPWTAVSEAEPIEDLWALGSVALSDAGIFLPLFHFNTNTWRYLRRNEKIKDQLSSYGRAVILPTEKDLKELLREGTNWKIVDSGVIPEEAEGYDLTKWIDDGQIMATTADYTYAGRRIGEVLDGWVLVGPQDDSQLPIARQGMQSEFIYDRKGQQTVLRQASARMVRLVEPKAIAWGTAYE